MTEKADGDEKTFIFDSSVKHLAWAIIESTSDCIFVTRHDGSLIYMNHASENLLNMTFTHAFGKSLPELLHIASLELSAGPGENSARTAQRSKSFDAAGLSGYWQFIRESESKVINISCSALPANSDNGCNYLFTLRVLDHLEQVTALSRKPRGGKNLINSFEFQSLFREALRKCQQFRTEHSLLCFELHESVISGSQHDNPPALQSMQMIRQAVMQTIPTASGICSISRNRFAILLEDCALPSSIPRAFSLANALRAAYNASHSAGSFACWVGIAPVHAQSPSSCADLIGMALQACLEAKQSSKAIAIRVHRSPRLAPYTAPLERRGNVKPD